MKNPFAVFGIILAILAGLSLYLAEGAAHRNEGMAAFVMLVIAVIFVKRIQRRT